MIASNCQHDKKHVHGKTKTGATGRCPHCESNGLFYQVSYKRPSDRSAGDTSRLYDLLMEIEEASHSMRAALELAAGSRIELRELANDKWDEALQRLRLAYAAVERKNSGPGREAGD